MRIEYTKQGTIKKYIVQGKVEVYQKDPALSSVLKRIADGGSVAALGDLGVFAAGLSNSFESDKLTMGDKITDKGQAIADSGYNWKGLSGRFILEVLNLENKLYLLDCINYNGQDNSAFMDTSEALNLPDEYSIGFSKGYRALSLNPHKQVVQTVKLVFVKVSYSFNEDKEYYSIQDSGDEFVSSENFWHTTFDNACKALKFILENYGLSVQGKEVYLTNVNKSNQLLRETIGILFDKRGMISAEKDGVKVKDVQLIVEEPTVADELLFEYLSRAASKQYLGYSEIAALISEFYGFFRHCSFITKNTNGVYSEMLERTSRENKKAYLRLQAYRDIVPDIATSAFVVNVKDLTNTQSSIMNVAQNLVGQAWDISSVTMITKYAFKNASISRAVTLLGNALKYKYNVGLTVITCKDNSYQAEVARDFYEQLKSSDNITFIERQKNDIEQIHDRYYRIVHNDGKVDWVVMTGELDALKYDKDFSNSRDARTDIVHTTNGYIKEMRIIRVSDDGIPSSVKAEMAEV